MAIVGAGDNQENAFDYEREEQHDNKENHPRLGRLLKLDLKHGVDCNRCNEAVVSKIEHATRLAHFYNGKAE
jgi:hypothetical protein